MRADSTAVVHPLAGANANNVAAAQNNGHPNEVAINVAAPPPQNNNNNNNNNLTREQKRARVIAVIVACVGFYSTIMLALVPSYYERHLRRHQQH